MGNPQINLNSVPLQPTLTDLLSLIKKDIMMNLNSHHVGVLQSFNGTAQTAVISIAYQKTYFQLDASTGVYTPNLVAYPTLIDCPVINLGGGTASLTFPYQKGDECLVLFNDRDFSNWFQSGSITQGNPTSRTHAFADAVCLVGLRSSPNKLTNYDLIRAVLQNGTTMVGVGPSLIKIANQTTTLKTLLGSASGLVKAIQDLANAITPTTGLSAGALATITAELVTLNTQIAGLLE